MNWKLVLRLGTLAVILCLGLIAAFAQTNGEEVAETTTEAEPDKEEEEEEEEEDFVYEPYNDGRVII